MIRQIVSNAAAMISGQVAVKALGLLWLIVLARYLGEESFGFLNYALSLAAIVSVIVEFGFSPVLTRAVARDPSLGQKYLSNVVALRLLLSLVGVPLAVLLSQFTGAGRADLLPVALAAATMITSAVWATPNALFVARERMRHPAVVMTASKIVSLLVGIWLVQRGAGLIAILLVFLLEGVLNVAVGLPLAARALGYRLRLEIDGKFCARLFRDALPFSLTLALGLIYYKVDVIMLSAMKGSAAVGLYSAAFRLLEGLVYVSAAFVGTMFPTLSRLKTTSEDTLRVTVQRAAEFVAALSLPLSAGIVLLSPEIVERLYGTEYAASAPALRWIGAALFFTFLSNFLGSTLGAVDRQGTAFRVTAVGVVVNLTLNALLIPRMAHVGAAIATAATQTAVAVLLVVLVVRHIGPRFDPGRLAKIVLAVALLAAAVTALAGAGLLVRIAAGAAVYFVALALFRVVTDEEMQHLRRAFGGRRP